MIETYLRSDYLFSYVRVMTLENVLLTLLTFVAICSIYMLPVFYGYLLQQWQQHFKCSH